MRRGLLIFIVLVGTAAGYKTVATSNYITQQQQQQQPQSFRQQKDTAEEEQETSVTSSTTSSAPEITTITVAAAATTTTKPIAEPPIKEEIALEEITAVEIPVPPSLPPPQLPIDIDGDIMRRRVVSYDQRQEGQYNIRADLENFMIVLIPPSPTEGLNLLDLLTKSALRRNAHTSSKTKRKHFGTSAGGNLLQTPSAAKYRQALKHGNVNQNFNYVAKQPSISETSRGGYFTSHPHSLATIESGGGAGTTSSSSSSSSSQRLPDFIEGRTPYHVDISASDDEQSRLHPDRQVDVLPPPYPLQYQHLIKPYHLDAEPTVIQALPPADVGSTHVGGAAAVNTGNFLENYNQYIADAAAAAASSNAAAEGSSAGYYRISRAIRGDNFLDSNINSLGGGGIASSAARRAELTPIYRSDHSLGADTLYPPIDVPHFSGYLTMNSRVGAGAGGDLATKRIDNHAQSLYDDTHVGEIIVPSHMPPLPEDDIELDLHNISFMDSAYKDMLKEYLGRCAPGHRRDSYGMCREIQGY